MRQILQSWWRWLLHGSRVLSCLFAAYLVVMIPISVVSLLMELCPAPWNLLMLVGLLIVIIVSVSLFGYSFTRLYTHSTWGHDANVDMKRHLNPSCRQDTKQAEQDVDGKP